MTETFLVALGVIANIAIVFISIQYNKRQYKKNDRDTLVFETTWKNHIESTIKAMQEDISAIYEQQDSRDESIRSIELNIATINERLAMIPELKSVMQGFSNNFALFGKTLAEIGVKVDMLDRQNNISSK